MVGGGGRGLPGPRRTGERHARTGGRSARVVASILAATVAELARSGYASFRIDEVAARAGVNKTTIYRRWPTKAELVRAALMASDDPGPPPSTGAVRSDLLALLRATIARIESSPEKLGILRMM